MVANVHLEHEPSLDHVKYAQAYLMLERSARYLNKHKTSSGLPLPFIMAGDFNSLPVSSAMSLLHNEDIYASEE